MIELAKILTRMTLESNELTHKTENNNIDHAKV